MPQCDCTINNVYYTTSSWSEEWRSDRGSNLGRVAAGYAHTQADDNDWMWWRTRVKITIPEFNGSSSALIFRLKTDTNSYPLNSYALISSQALTRSQVGVLTKKEATHGCSCTSKTLKSHEVVSSTLTNAAITTSFAFANEDATSLPSDNKSGETLYYRFNTTTLKAGVYYIYIMYKHRSGNKHGFVAGTNYKAYLIYNNLRTLKVQASINGKIVNNFGNYADVYINGTKYSTYNKQLTYDTFYRISASVPGKDGLIEKYKYNGTEYSGKLVTDTTITLPFVTKQLFTFDANGGTTSIYGTLGKTYGVDVTLPTCTKTGYNLMGWLSSRDGNIYAGGSVYSKDPDEPLNSNNTINEDERKTTFIAQWSPASIKVTLDGNGGLVIPKEVYVNYNSKYFDSLPTPTREGYSFTGWYTAKNNGTKITSNTRVTTTSNHTLYAMWSQNVYTVTYNYTLEGKVFSLPKYSDNVTFEEVYNVRSAPIQAGYTFDGWYLDGKTVGNTITIKGNTVLSGEFQKVPCIKLCKNREWKVVVPHIYKNSKWQPMCVKFYETAQSIKEFKIYNWLDK